ncbi:hypothetical protein [Subdoligranulum variabile]|uniref:hypothetical protein n=1 Tax=Subdoligranulum variabile TaxID=214851 RepID=UPI0026F3191C|nr:hypothetical protein [Subdoligranulum variabile]
MNEKTILAIFVGIIVFFILIGMGDTSSTSNNSTSSSNYYQSGKGSDWDEQVNDIYNEYGEDAGMSAAEIDAAMRAMEQGLKEQG